MPAYKYMAKDSDGCKFSGVYTDVESIKQLKNELSKMGYKLIRASRDNKSIFLKKTRISQTELVTFTYEFAGMYSAGLSVLRCLETLENQCENLSLKTIIKDVKNKVEVGQSLKDAFEPYKTIFTEFFIGMLEAGESGGKLSDTLTMAAQYLEKQHQMKSKIKSAFTYPLIVGTMCLSVIFVLELFIVPVFQKLYSQLNVPLPVPTLILISASRLCRSWWPIVLPVIAACIIFAKVLIKNKLLKQWADAVKLKMPVFGKINTMVTVSKFVRTTAMMASAGVPLDKALQMAIKVVDNSHIKKIGKDIQEKVMTGSTLAEPLANHQIFPAIIIQLATAGEEAGVLPQMLLKGVEFVEDKTQRMVMALIAKIEPVLTLIMGLLVGLVLLGVYLPMFDYMSHFE